jgi:hypothetical protein
LINQSKTVTIPDRPKIRRRFMLRPSLGFASGEEEIRNPKSGVVDMSAPQSFSVGSPAAFQAAIPPRTFVTSS